MNDREAKIVAALRAAVELHRPQMYDRYARATRDVDAMKWTRCAECRDTVPPEGCKTWRTAFGS